MRRRDTPDVLAAHPYGGRARILAERLKNPLDDEARREAAEDMAPLVPRNAVLVPAPSSTGRNPATWMLARAIGRLADVPVVDAVGRAYPIRSSFLARRTGTPTPTLTEQIASMERQGELPRGRRVILVDNVVSSGNTFHAARETLGVGARGLAYADARRYVRSNEGALRVGVIAPDWIPEDDVEAIVALVPPGCLAAAAPWDFLYVFAGAGVGQAVLRRARDTETPVEVIGIRSAP